MLWILAGAISLVPRLFFGGGGLSLGIGMMFIVFGIVSRTRGRIAENAQFFDFELLQADMNVLDALDEGKRVGPDPDNFDF